MEDENIPTLSQAKINILRVLWEADKPLTLKEISVRAGVKPRSANMHLLNLRMMGYVETPRRGFYALTDEGKAALGLPRVDGEGARRILGEVPPEKAFHFYLKIGSPLGLSARSLTQFCEMVKTINIKSIEFHTARGDFELWIHFLGDVELAKRIRLLREKGLSGEELRGKLYKIIKSRCEELRRIVQKGT
ncbi:hypothetical protein DRO55_00955 [Candidatus Bathyarchaeota archaeon]|nr:MAG: hypothetical protein DRO55_00955 [Candidatus Bathyarchaeota archaeon]